MKLYFDNIFYSQKDIDFTLNNESIKYPVIIIPHAAIKYISSLYVNAFSSLLVNENILFIAPLHNGRFLTHPRYKYTISSTSFENISIKSFKDTTIEDSILEEEYSLEIILNYLKAFNKNINLYPLFVDLKSDNDTLELSRIIKEYSNLNFSFIISGNFSHEGKSETILQDSRRLEEALEKNISLIDLKKDGLISGCASLILEAFRDSYNSYKTLMREEIKKDDRVKVIHIAGAKYNDTQIKNS